MGLWQAVALRVSTRSKQRPLSPSCKERAVVISKPSGLSPHPHQPGQQGFLPLPELPGHSQGAPSKLSLRIGRLEGHCQPEWCSLWREGAGWEKAGHRLRMHVCGHRWAPWLKGHCRPPAGVAVFSSSADGGEEHAGAGAGIPGQASLCSSSDRNRSSLPPALEFFWEGACHCAEVP